MVIVKKVIWVGDSLKVLKSFPEEVRDGMGYALHKVQSGETPRCAKVLKGFKPAVMEIIADYDTNAYRAVYTVKLGSSVYVLHCFEKKSKRGIKTPKQELSMIKQRLREAKLVSQNKEVVYGE